MTTTRGQCDAGDGRPALAAGRLDPAGTAAILACSLCWGATPVLLRHLTSAIDAWTANGFRYPASAILFWPILHSAWRSGQLNQAILRKCLLPSCLALSGQILWALAPYYLGASLVGFFIRFSLVWSFVGAMILFRDERRLLTVGRFHLGVILCVFGLVVLSLSQRHDALKVNSAGLAIIMACSAFFGLYAVSVRQSMSDLDPLIGFGIVSQFVSAGTLLGMLLLGKPHILWELSASTWSVLMISSLLGIALGHVFLYTAVRRLGAALSSGVLAITPFVTTALAALLLGERLTERQWLAGAAMVAGAVTLLSAQRAIRFTQPEAAAP